MLSHTLMNNGSSEIDAVSLIYPTLWICEVEGFRSLVECFRAVKLPIHDSYVNWVRSPP